MVAPHLMSSTSSRKRSTKSFFFNFLFFLLANTANTHSPHPTPPPTTPINLLLLRFPNALQHRLRLLLAPSPLPPLVKRPARNAHTKKKKRKKFFLGVPHSQLAPPMTILAHPSYLVISFHFFLTSVPFPLIRLLRFVLRLTRTPSSTPEAFFFCQKAGFFLWR